MTEVTCIRFTHKSGIPNIPRTAQVDISIQLDHLSFVQTTGVPGQKNIDYGKAYIMFDQLISGGMVTNLDAEAKNTAAGSAALGAFLLGTTGAIIGAASAGDKSDPVVEYYFSLNYKANESGEVKTLLFIPKPEKEKNYQKFMDQLKKAAPQFIDNDKLPDKRKPIHL